MTDFLSQLVRRSETEAVAREKKHQQELREREEAEAAPAEAKRQQELREAAQAAEAEGVQRGRSRDAKQELRQRKEAEAVAAEAKRQQELRQRKAAEAAAAEAKRQQELRQREEAEAAAAAEARRQQLRARQRLIYFATVVLLCLTSVGAFLHWGTLGPRDNSLSVPPLSSVEDKAKPSVPPRHEPATSATSKPANTQVGPSAATGPHPSLEAPPGGTAPQQPTSNDGLDAQTPPPNATPLVAPPPAVPSALAEAPALGLPEAQQSDPVPTERTSPSTFLAPPQQAAEQPQLAPNAPVAKPSPRRARRMRFSGGWRRTTPEPVSRMRRRPSSRPRPSKTTLIRLCAGCGRTGRAGRNRPLLRFRSLAFRCHLIRSRLVALSDFYASR